MHQAAVEFSQDTLDSERRETMVAAARVLLMGVTRLMVVVDAVDVQRMFRTFNRVQYTRLGLVCRLNKMVLSSTPTLSTPLFAPFSTPLFAPFSTPLSTPPLYSPLYFSLYSPLYTDGGKAAGSVQCVQ